MICMRCKKRESTGILIHLCDKCFDEFEAEVDENPKSVDLEPVDLAMKHQRIGGLVPDNAKGVRIRGTIDDVKIDIVQ